MHNLAPRFFEARKVMNVSMPQAAMPYVDILVRGNRVSGLEETACPDNGNRKLITHASFYRAHKLPALKYPY